MHYEDSTESRTIFNFVQREDKNKRCCRHSQSLGCLIDKNSCKRMQTAAKERRSKNERLRGLLGPNLRGLLGPIYNDTSVWFSERRID